MSFYLLNNYVCRYFRYYGLCLWFPEYIKHLQTESYLASTQVLDDGIFSHVLFNTSLDNIEYYNYMFNNVQFQDLTLSHVLFHNSTFINCTFSNIKSGKSFFVDSFILGTKFIDTDFHDYRFQNTKLENSSFHSTKTGCAVDFALNYDLSEVFVQNFIGQLSMIPGTIVATFLIDRVGRSRLMSKYTIYITTP